MTTLYFKPYYITFIKINLGFRKSTLQCEGCAWYDFVNLSIRSLFLFFVSKVTALKPRSPKCENGNAVRNFCTILHNPGCSAGIDVWNKNSWYPIFNFIFSSSFVVISMSFSFKILLCRGVRRDLQAIWYIYLKNILESLIKIYMKNF